MRFLLTVYSCPRSPSCWSSSIWRLSLDWNFQFSNFHFPPSNGYAADRRMKYKWQGNLTKLVEILRAFIAPTFSMMSAIFSFASYNCSSVLLSCVFIFPISPISCSTMSAVTISHWVEWSGWSGRQNVVHFLKCAWNWPLDRNRCSQHTILERGYIWCKFVQLVFCFFCRIQKLNVFLFLLSNFQHETDDLWRTETENN